MAQRFITGLDVFDTYSGLTGTIQEANLDPLAVPTLAPTFTGAFFTVKLSTSALQVFTIEGKRVDHTTGVVLDGITLLTLVEYRAMTGVGYPSV
jgi:hypothetical protein